MYIRFLENTDEGETELFLIQVGDTAVPQAGQELWIGRKRYGVINSPVWTVHPPSHEHRFGNLGVDVVLQRTNVLRSEIGE